MFTFFLTGECCIPDLPELQLPLFLTQSYLYCVDPSELRCFSPLMDFNSGSWEAYYLPTSFICSVISLYCGDEQYLLIQILQCTLKRTGTEGNAKNNECQMYPVAKRKPGFPTVLNLGLADVILLVKLACYKHPFLIMRVSFNYSHHWKIMPVSRFVSMYVIIPFKQLI